jgi:hypothetical protein
VSTARRLTRGRRQTARELRDRPRSQHSSPAPMADGCINAFCGSLRSLTGPATKRPRTAMLRAGSPTTRRGPAGAIPAPTVSPSRADSPRARCAVSALCETAPNGVEMRVTQAKRVSPTPPGGGRYRSMGKGAVKRDRCSSIRPPVWSAARGGLAIGPVACFDRDSRVAITSLPGFPVS